MAVSDSDHVNMLACTLAKDLGAKRRVLRLRDFVAPGGLPLLLQALAGLRRGALDGRARGRGDRQHGLRAERARGRALRRRAHPAAALAPDRGERGDQRTARGPAAAPGRAGRRDLAQGALLRARRRRPDRPRRSRLRDRHAGGPRRLRAPGRRAAAGAPQRGGHGRGSHRAPAGRQARLARGRLAAGHRARPGARPGARRRRARAGDGPAGGRHRSRPAGRGAHRRGQRLRRHQRRRREEHGRLPAGPLAGRRAHDRAGQQEPPTARSTTCSASTAPSRRASCARSASCASCARGRWRRWR